MLKSLRPATADTPENRPTIAVRELRVGMFIHLNNGWLSHPFPLSSFRIANQEQLATLRALKLEQVRWSPDKSDLPAEDSAGLAPAPETLPGVDPAAAAHQARRQALVDQRAAALAAERQYGEAASAVRQASELAFADPPAGRAATEGVTRAMLDKMLCERELSIRVLTEAAGERASSHALNVAVIGLLMGKLLGLPDAELMDLGVGALLHDIGKAALPDRVRFADNCATAAEAKLYREHVAHGVSQGRLMGLSAGALLVVAQHHEQVDGSGFPLRIGAERMTAASRIVSLINRYDNLCNPAVTANGLTPHEALSLMFAQGQQKFDIAMLNAFIRMMGVYPPGSAVQLTDDRYALVMTVNSARPLKPRVLVHDPRVPRDEALYLDLEKIHGLGIRRSLKPAQLPAAALAYLAPRPRIAYYFEPVLHAEADEETAA